LKPLVKERKMKRKITIVVLLVFVSAVTVLPALALAPGIGTVYEGVSVPGIAIGDTRAQVEAANGLPRSCHDLEEVGDVASCKFEVSGGGTVSVIYKGQNGGNSSGSLDDVVAVISWAQEVDGWVTTAGINITKALDQDAVKAAYPNADLYYDSVGRLYYLKDPELGIAVSWNFIYFYSASMSIFAPYTPPPPPELIRIADIEMSYDRRSVTARVKVVDEQGQPVEGAIVGGYWVYPINKNNNTTLFIEATTTGDGYAIFGIDKARPGDYRININYVTKEGYKFDYDNSIILGTITKPK